MDKKTLFRFLGLVGIIIGLLVYMRVGNIPMPNESFKGGVLSATDSAAPK